MHRLNTEQYRASRSGGGVNLVIAGAGTGKTKTLIEKVKNVIRYSDIEAGNILILTFSRKAAEEIRERVGETIGSAAADIFAGTFHSFCLDLLKTSSDRFLKAFGYDAFPAVIGDDRKQDIARALILPRREQFLGLPDDVVYDFMVRLDRLDDSLLARLHDTGIYDEISRLRCSFHEYKVSQGFLDFDDMMHYAADLLREDEELQGRVLARYRYVFVDEFQDTSDDNFRLLEQLLPEEGRSLFAVGDDWQSIYGFRNARIDYIINMKKYFPEASVHRLKINYRSRKEIVSLSNKFIKKNKNRTRKRLASFKGRGGSVKLHGVKNFIEEAEVIQKIFAEGQSSWDSCAVLTRNNWQAEYLQSVAGTDEDMADVQFMTMHASKGLEFDQVIVAGVSDMIIPDRDNDIEEERRLMYVALTRAREELHVLVHHDEKGVPAQFGRELGVKKG